MSYVWLFVIGGALIVFELFNFTYFSLFIGLGVVLVGVLELFGVFANTSEPFAWQLVCTAAFSMLFLLTCRPYLKRVLKSGEKFNEKFKERGVGEVTPEGLVSFRGSLWHAKTDGFEAGTRVEVEIDASGAAKIIGEAKE